MASAATNDTVSDAASSLSVYVSMSIESVATLIVQYLAGAVAAYLNLISEEQVQAIGGPMNLLLIPCLIISSLGKGISYDLLVRQGGWILAAIGFISSLAYAAIGFGLRILAKPEPAFARLFIVMLAVPNVVAIPISLSESLCHFGAFDDDFGSREDCVERARAFVFVRARDARPRWLTRARRRR